MQQKLIQRLKCQAQKYACGMLSNNPNCLVYQLTSIKDNALSPYAELWMGSHPSLPSLQENGEKLLLPLPYLFKVLSVDQPLSIQIHPNKVQAQLLHVTKPNLYPDDNHKPEMAIALTDFEALVGFADQQIIVQNIENNPHLLKQINPQIWDNFKNTDNQQAEHFLKLQLLCNTMILDNMHIVKVIDTHTDYQKRNYQILYEHCQGGRLSKFLEQDKLDDQTLGAIFYQMIEALAYVHGLGMSHDELTIDSFSIFDDSATPFVKLTDIRSIYQFVYTKNSIYYEPSESIGHHQHNPHDKAHSEQLIQTKNRSQANDIWALGIIMLQLINKKLPFDPEIETIHHFHPETHFKKQSEINQLLLEMLKKHPESRLSLSQCLLHPCLQKMKQVQREMNFTKMVCLILFGYINGSLHFGHPELLQFVIIQECIFKNTQDQNVKMRLMYQIMCIYKHTYLTYILYNKKQHFQHIHHSQILYKQCYMTPCIKLFDGSLSKQELIDLFKTEGKDLVDQLDLEDDLTLEDFQLMAADKELILNENVLESSFRTFSKSYNNISAKFICKTIVECDEEKIQSDFDTYNLNYSFCFKEYSEFLQNYQSPKAIQ